MHPGGTTHTADRMLHVQKRPGCIDLSEFQNGWHPETVHVLIDRVFPNAPAHTLADEVVAVFRSLELWGQLELLDAPRNGSSTNNNKLIVWMRGGTKLTHPYETLARHVGVRDFSELPHSTCFRNVLVGWSALNFMKGQQKLIHELPTWTETKSSWDWSARSIALSRLGEEVFDHRTTKAACSPRALHREASRLEQ